MGNGPTKLALWRSKPSVDFWSVGLCAHRTRDHLRSFPYAPEHLTDQLWRTGSEKAQTVFPIKIHHISVGKTHVAAVLDNAVSSGGKDFGRDVFLWWVEAVYFFVKHAFVHKLTIDVWFVQLPPPQKKRGHNADCQLGNQKRANLAVPQHISPLPRPELQNPSLREVTETIESGTSSPMPHNRLQLSPKKRIARHDAEETVTAGWYVLLFVFIHHRLTIEHS